MRHGRDRDNAQTSLRLHVSGAAVSGVRDRPWVVLATIAFPAEPDGGRREHIQQRCRFRTRIGALARDHTADATLFFLTCGLDWKTAA